MKRLQSAAACVIALGVAVSGPTFAEPQTFPYFPNGIITPQSALSAEELERESFLNTASDADMLKAGPKKEDVRSKANVSIFGSIVNNRGSALCALVLANGQFMFSCAPNGTWSLTVPQDASGQVTLFGFADTHMPYRLNLSSGGRYDMVLTYAGTVIDPPPPSMSTITFTITDGCNNGIQIRYKFYDVTNNLVWPSATTHYFTEFFNASYTHNLSCRTGANVCYGARSSSFYWGVDVDGSKFCPDCCITCQSGNSLSRRLTC